MPSSIRAGTRGITSAVGDESDEERGKYLLRRCLEGTAKAVRLPIYFRLLIAGPMTAAWYAAMRANDHDHEDAKWFALGMGAAILDGPRPEED